MVTVMLPAADPWRTELIVVAGGAVSSTDRRSISRDRVRGRVVRLVPGAYVDRLAYEALTPTDQHIVRMRALAATTSAPLVFSHWSAAVLHGLPVLAERLTALHVLVVGETLRPRRGATGHAFPVAESEVVRFGPLLATGVGRTVVDLAGAAPFPEGVTVADGALAAGVPRAVLEAAVDLAGPRRASTRIDQALAFAHPGAESAAESRWRVTSFRVGAEVPVLQREVRLRDGSAAFLDGWLPTSNTGVEIDGAVKLLDPVIAPDARKALLREKRREDDVRGGLAGLVRLGWVQSGSAPELRTAYERAGVRPAVPRPSFEEHCEAARAARPRRPPRDPRWRA